MIKHEKILNYIENSQKDDGSSQIGVLPLKICKILWILSVISVIFINLIMIFGMNWLYLGENALPTNLTHSEIIADIVIRIIANIILIAAIVLLCKNLNKIATASTLIIAIFLGIFRYLAIRDVTPLIVGEHIDRFFVQHALPLGILAILSTIILAIFVSRKRCNDKIYKEIETKLYKDYQSTVELSSEQGWQKYLDKVDVSKALKP